MFAEGLTTGGLALDILGAMLIFKFWIGPEVRRGGSGFLVVTEDTEEAKKARWFDGLGRVGALLIVLGFGVQIAGVWVP